MPYTPIVYVSVAANGLPNIGAPWTNPTNAQGAPNGVVATRSMAVLNGKSDGLDLTFPAVAVPGTLTGIRFTPRLSSNNGNQITWEMLRGGASVGVLELAAQGSVTGFSAGLVIGLGAAAGALLGYAGYSLYRKMNDQPKQG